MSHWLLLCFGYQKLPLTYWHLLLRPLSGVERAGFFIRAVASTPLRHRPPGSNPCMTPIPSSSVNIHPASHGLPERADSPWPGLAAQPPESTWLRTTSVLAQARLRIPGFHACSPPLPGVSHYATVIIERGASEKLRDVLLRYALSAHFLCKPLFRNIRHDIAHAGGPRALRACSSKSSSPLTI